MQDAQEFTVKSSPASQGCSPQTVMITVPGLNDDRDFAVAIGRITALASTQRLAVIAFIEFWFSLHWARRATLAKAADPDLTDNQIGILVGRSRRHLLRNDGYKRLKPKLDDLKARLPLSDFSAKRRKFTSLEDYNG